jgi:hypothetical protein
MWKSKKYSAIPDKDLPLSGREVVCGLFNNTFSSSDYIALNDGMNNEWEKVLSQHLHGGTEENHENLSVRVAGLQTET